jgi:hypothetical protein
MTAIFPKGVTLVATSVINIKCPICRHSGAFSGYNNVNDIQWGPVNKQRPNGGAYQIQSFAGLRECPNNDCKGLVFVSRDAGTERVTSYPPEVIDFDATNLPQPILLSLEEAIKCHSVGCYKASALMVRRVLEELCDNKNATGNNLKARIESLSSVAVIPTELLSAADELRILGNDAAHVEAKDYDQITEVEAELAIELAKELLKSVYQFETLVNRLKALKRPAVVNP